MLVRNFLEILFLTWTSYRGAFAHKNCVGSSCDQNNFGRRNEENAEATHDLTIETLEADDGRVKVEVLFKSKNSSEMLTRASL